MLLACREGRLPENAGAMRLATFYGSVLPAIWSFMLAARARGLGTVFTTTHLDYEREVAVALNIPFDSYTQVALVPIGFVKGEGAVQLAPEAAGTLLKYSGDISAGGPIASLGQRMIGGAARMIIDQFFKCVAGKLAA